MTPNEEIRRAQSKGNLVNSEPLSAHHANLCRSAQAVIEAAIKYDRSLVNTRQEEGAIYELHFALAAHAKLEQGTGE